MKQERLGSKTRLEATASTATLTLLRVVVGVIFVAHGWTKLTDTAGTANSFAGMGVPLPNVTPYLAIAGEFFGGLALLMGLLTKLAALGTFCVMLSAMVFVHLGNGLFASGGGWEYPLTLLLVSLVFIARGPGPISVDALISKYRRQRDRAPRHEPQVGGGPARQHPA